METHSCSWCTALEAAREEGRSEAKKIRAEWNERAARLQRLAVRESAVRGL